MNQQQLQSALDELPAGQQESSCVKRFAELIDGELPLQSFLEQLLPEVASLLGGMAGVAWMKAQGAPGAVFGVRYRMEGVVSSVTEHKKHDRLVQIAWQQKQPMLAEPTQEARGKGVDSEKRPELPGKDEDNDEGNPTKHALVFGPVTHAGEVIALLEIVLCKTERALTQQEKQLYLRATQLICDRVYGGLRKRMSIPDPTLQQAVDQMNQLTTEIQSVQQKMVRMIESRLQLFHGWSFPSLRENQALAKMIHQMLDSHGLRVQCPECKNAAILRCLSAGNAKNGAFVFDHYLETGRTFHGGTTSVPLLKVVKKPARRTALRSPA